MTRADVATNPRTIARRAAAAARERRADRVALGWWVYSHGSNFAGWWGRVTRATSYVDDDGKAAVQLSVIDPATGRHGVIQCPAGAPASCLSPTEARRAGLT